MPGLADAARGLAERRGIEHRPELVGLLDHLFGLSCRDQELSAFDPGKMAARRRHGFALAKSLRKEAVAVLDSLERLHRDWCAFDDEVRLSPALLEVIFDVDLGGPEEICLPDELAIVQTLFRTQLDDEADKMGGAPFASPGLSSLSPLEPCPAGLWEAIDRRLQAVSELPIRDHLPRGPAPNMVVRAAVDACRSYWAASGGSWSMAGLKVAAVRRENVVGNLTGRCEQFVADALTVAGIKFNLSELHAAWEFVDTGARSPSSKPSS